MSKRLVTRETLQKRQSILRILGLSLIFCSTITFLILVYRTSNKIEEQKITIVQKDALVASIKDSTNAVLSKQDTIKSILKEFFRLRSAHKADSLESYFSDTVQKFFVNLENVPRGIVTENSKEYWAKYPADCFKITDSIHIAFNGQNCNAIIKGVQCFSDTKCFDEVLEIHLDARRKINFMRAFYARN